MSGTIYLRVPIRRGHTDEMVEVLQLLSGPLEQQNREKAEELGVTREKWWLVHEHEDDVLYVGLVAEDTGMIIKAFEESGTPIAIWLRTKLRTHTCYDPQRLEGVAGLPEGDDPQLIAEWANESG